MLAPRIPKNEPERLIALQGLALLDTQPAEAYDRLTRLASEEFKVGICAISLVDRDRQWFKSISGLSVKETSREISFCGHTILDEGCFVVLDTFLDDRFADNPLVTDEPKIRFYAGCPVHDPSFHRIGSICLIDSAPRSFDRKDMVKLHEYASDVEAQIEKDYLVRLQNSSS